MNEIIDTCLFEGGRPRRLPRKNEASGAPNPDRIFPAGRDAATRSPHCFSVGNARARYSHTAPRRVE